MMVNRHVLIAAFVIGGAGIVRYFTGGTAKGVSLTRILVGGYVLILVLALLDISSALRPLVSALATLAMISVIFASGVVQWLAGLVAPGGGPAHAERESRP